MEAEKRVLLR